MFPALSQHDITQEAEDRFWDSFDDDPSGCWVWNGAHTSKGYGHLRNGDGWVQAHRLAWVIIESDIEEGLVIDHICRNRSCVCPDHMELVTNQENTLRGVGPTAVNAKKTHCIHGHDLSEAYIEPKTGSRKCRACNRRRQDWYKRAVKRRPTRSKPPEQVLAKEIKLKSFRLLGLKYGVTDSCIRNWAKSYGITWKKHARAGSR